MPFANLGNLLGDLDFWGGVATGAGEQMLLQEERKDKDIRELRNFGMTRGMQIEEDNRDAVNAAETQVKELASLISGDRSANAPEVMEAAYYLIDQEGGISGANRVAQLLNTEYSTYGVDPIAKMGLQERSIGDVPTARDVARTVTRLKPLPDIKASGIETRRTALDVIFGGETAETKISREMSEMFGTDQDTMADMSPVSAAGIDEEFILGSNFNNELVRMNTLLNKHNQVSVQNRDSEWLAIEGVIKSNIDMLSEAKKMAELQQNQMSDSTRESFEKGFMRNLVSAGQLKGDFDVAGNYEAKGVKSEIYGEAVAAVATMGNLAQLARNKGYLGIDDQGNKYDPIEFIKIFGSAGMKKIILVTPEDGEPYLSVGDDIFDEATRQSPAWTQSTIQNSSPPSVGGGTSGSGGTGSTGSGTGTVTGAGSSVIPDSLLTNVQSTTPSTRKAAANAIMTRIKRANQGKTQAEYEAEFKRITGLEYSVASS
tara:strand:- start:2529 stop:3986 length:1458 start_codon:yes stop_codon:yes gene_type:complete